MYLLPAIMKDHNEDYYQRADKVLYEYHDIMPERLLWIPQVIKRLWNEEDILKTGTKDKVKDMLLEAEWQVMKENPKAVEDMLDDLKNGNRYYTAIETDKGILFFSRDMEGQKQCEDYLNEFIANRFFDPGLDIKRLTVHECRGWPSIMDEKVNRCRNCFGEWEPEDIMKQWVYRNKSELKNVTDSETYDLAPAWENYARLTDNEKGLGLARSVDNYDRMTLLYIMDKGYPRDGLTDEYPDNFSFHEKFERIENKLLGRDRWAVYDEMQEKAKRLAERLLKENFPGMRQKETAMPEMKTGKEAPKKSKGRKI